MKVSHFLLVLMLGCGSLQLARSQRATASENVVPGLPYITTFAPYTYQAHKQNWGVIQDSLGMLYFANGDGVLIWNGSEWSLVPLPGESMASSVAIDEKSQQIFVGGWGTFGVLKYHQNGQAYYQALSDRLETEADKVTRVYETIVTTSGVYFQTTEAIYRYQNNGEIYTWYRGPKQLGKLFYVNERLLVKWHYKGVYEIVGDEWHLLPDSEQFGGVFIHCILPFDQQRLLFSVDASTLYLYDDQKFTQFESRVNDYLKEHRIYCGIKGADDSYFFGTVNGGIIGMDQEGEINLLINDARYLLSLNIRNFLVDKNKNLVVAMDVGVALVEFPSPYTIFKIDQQEVEINDFTRLGDKLFAGTETGLLELSADSEGHQVFKKVTAFAHKIWGILNVDNRLIVANEYGVHEMLENGDVNTILKGLTPGLQQSTINPHRVYVFQASGISSLLYKEGRWLQDTIIPDFNRRMRKVIELDDKNIWLDTDWTEAYHVSFTQDSGAYYWQDPQLTRYDTSQGMPADRGSLYAVAGSLYFVPRSLSANYVWNEISTTFEIDTQLYRVVNTSDKDAILWDVDNQKNVWYVSHHGDFDEHLGLSLLVSERIYHPADLHFDRILDDIGNAILFDNDTIWHGGFSSIVKQNIKIKNPSPNLRMIISKIIYQTDSVLSFGAYNQLQHSLDFSQNAIDFHFGISELAAPNSIYYQTYLQGNDHGWSGWTKEKHRQYFGLSPGQYTFQVRARNGENQETAIEQYTFQILAPWYRRWWALAIYLLSAFWMVTGIVRWRNLELIRKNEKLERVVRQRTIEVEDRNEQLSVQAKKLQELDQLKTNLFANISHEFRTPLTLIKAPVEQLEREPEKILSVDEVGMIRRNADRLLRLVNQLLDLAKLDAQSLKLDFTEGDIYRFFRVEASSFSSLAAQRNIDFEIKIPTDQLWASFDRDKLETIMYNLLNNAFKFTPAGGQVKLLVIHRDDELRVEVTDTGPGIASEHLDQVFNRFYQVEKMGKTGQGGTGIGLALCRELAGLMRGTIKVESRLQYGTSFYLIIPLVEIINTTFVADDFKKPTPEFVGGSGATLPSSGDIVLIVEDHPDMRRYLKSILEKQYTLVEAEDGKAGFEKAVKEIPDLIITDTMMPSMDGNEFSQSIKNDERTSHIPIIMLTAKATLENKLSSLSSGVDTYLTKPFNAQELEASIKALLLERKRLRRLFSKQLLVAPQQFTINSLDQQFLEKVNTVLENQYSDSTFGVPQMQTALVMSKTQLHRKLTAITNQAPGEFLRNFRLQRAAQILGQKGDTVTQVAYSVGFENVPYFTTCFKDLFGVNPSKYGK